MQPSKRWRIAALLAWLVSIMLLAWALRGLDFTALMDVLLRLKLWQILILILLNGAILFLFGSRWWLFVRVLGYRVPLLSILRYRLAAFSVGYFTPGPQFGGEPLQVYLLNRREDLPGPAALIAVTLDKLLELASNLGFLVWALFLVLSSGLFSGLTHPLLLVGILVLSGMPLVYLGVLWAGKLPFSRLLHKAPGRFQAVPSIQKLSAFVYSSETEASAFCIQHPLAFLQGAALSLLAWGLTIVEFWLTLRFLGLDVSLVPALGVMVAARMAFLAPTPGGLGALEAGQVWALGILGYPPAAALSLVLLIRARDISLGMVGFWFLSRLWKTPGSNTAEGRGDV
jgi:glycosyltransferase 2 family protein